MPQYENPNLVIKTALILISALLLNSACSTMDSVAPSGNRSVTPDQIVQRKGAPTASPVEWGGVIISLKNLKRSTELEAIAYPLMQDGRPDTDKPPVGRFIAVKDGYLEPVDYARGRQVTASGKIDRLREGKVGEAAYVFPVLLIRQIRLWPKRYVGDSSPGFNFGFGASSGGSIGVGIGF
jgi:outer membrane lipoprotein